MLDTEHAFGEFCHAHNVTAKERRLLLDDPISLRMALIHAIGKLLRCGGSYAPGGRRGLAMGSNAPHLGLSIAWQDSIRTISASALRRCHVVRRPDQGPDERQAAFSDAVAATSSASARRPERPEAKEPATMSGHAEYTIQFAAAISKRSWASTARPGFVHQDGRRCARLLVAVTSASAANAVAR